MCKTLFSKIFTVLFSIAINAFFSAQAYQIKYTFSGKDIKQSEQKYVLDILNNKSVFRAENRRISDSLLARNQYGFSYETAPNRQLYIVKDLKSNIFTKHYVSLSRDRYFIKEMPELNWQIADETAKIGEFHCQKAMVNYGGRNWTAWFTKDIALAEGPYYFHGLPGLIVKISDTDDNFVFTLSSLKKYEEDSLYLPKGGKEITWKQYQQLQQQLYDDPMFAMRSIGISKLSKNDGSGGSIPMNQSELIGNIRKTLITNNNPLELDQKVDFK